MQDVFPTSPQIATALLLIAARKSGAFFDMRMPLLVNRGWIARSAKCFAMKGISPMGSGGTGMGLRKRMIDLDVFLIGLTI